jgi:hypothetical protein
VKKKVLIGDTAHMIFPSVDHKDDISREQLKELLYDEIMSFTPSPIT